MVFASEKTFWGAVQWTGGWFFVSFGGSNDQGKSCWRESGALRVCFLGWKKQGTPRPLGFWRLQVIVSGGLYRSIFSKTDRGAQTWGSTPPQKSKPFFQRTEDHKLSPNIVGS